MSFMLFIAFVGPYLALAVFNLLSMQKDGATPTDRSAAPVVSPMGVTPREQP